MNDSPSELLAELDALRQDVRRQGRASIAAQAAAEACAEQVRALATKIDRGARSATTVSLDFEALLPVLDGLPRAVEQVRRSLAALERPLVLRRRGVAEVRALAEGLRLLDEQARDALGELGITILDPLGERVDPQLHRVIEVRPGPSGLVLEVVRRGYMKGERVLREAEVVVGR